MRVGLLHIHRRDEWLGPSFFPGAGHYRCRCGEEIVRHRRSEDWERDSSAAAWRAYLDQ